MSKMNPEVKAKWVAALRSGEYMQARYRLKRGDGHCCLGVLCDLYGKETGKEWKQEHTMGGDIRNYFLDQDNALPDEVRDWSGLSSDGGALVAIRGVNRYLSTHNDAGAPFAEIADAIESQL